ncbi:MAG: adenylosuccinate lyase [Lentisphaerae bacterium]|nr:adenylosuccinate lyase [Lentisphaerota bacterium]
MSVHPIEFRYYSEAMRALFTEEAKLQYWLAVEAALARAHARLGHIPKAAAAVISRKATIKKVRLERVKTIEAEIHHDLMAMVQALSEICGKQAGKYVHLGATSYDIEDTALALQLSQALNLIAADTRTLLKTLLELARRTRRLVCVGRTHGQHAVPTTYGLKFAIFAGEIARHLARLAEAQRRIRVGKMTGAVGTQASFGRDAPQLQRLVMKALGLAPVMVANQVIQRDRHAEVVFALALLATTAEKIATEIRNLQRTEIGEVSESFQKKQVGSSTMPQKRNPHKSERVCSLARIIRALVPPALENIPLEHERDLTNSAAERVIFPEAFILTDYVLRQLDEILQGLQIDKRAIQRNLDLTGGLIMSERLMLALVKRGVGRQEAHAILRHAAQTALAQGQPFKEILAQDERIMKFLATRELEHYLDPAGYIGTAVKQVDAVLAALRKE